MKTRFVACCLVLSTSILFLPGCASKPKQELAMEPASEPAAAETTPAPAEKELSTEYMNPDAEALPVTPATEPEPARAPHVYTPAAHALGSRPGSVLSAPYQSRYSTSSGYPEARHASTRTTTRTSANTSMPASGGSSYTVKRGDSLWLISKRSGVSANAIAEANGISTETPLKIGKTLTIPGGHKGSAAQSVHAAAKSHTTAPAHATAQSAQAAASSGEKTYTVQKGDSYDRIAKKLGVSSAKLMAANNTASPNLRAGQVIKVP